MSATEQRRTTARGILAFAPFALVAWSAGVGAQPSAADRALAETLFRQARELVKNQQWAEACPKLEESQRLDPGGGTLLNLALCHEGQGRLAAAWVEFRDALVLAKKDNKPERERLARERLTALEPKVPRLVVTVPESTRVTGLEIALDDAPLRTAAWQTPIPIDPGEHTLAARAPGKRPWRASVTATAGSNSDVTVPQLVDEEVVQAPSAAAAVPVATAAGPSPPPTPSGGPPEEPARSTTARTVGLVVGGLGIAAIGVGGYFGIRAISKRHESDDACPHERCTDAGLALNEQAKHAATAANVTIGLGAAALVTGVVLVLISSAGSATRAPPRAARGPWAPARPGGLGWGVAF